jgi:carbon storage regulator
MEGFRMLVLTRKLGEKILIGDGITITVVDIGKSRVKVGIEAPAGHKILREELALAAGQTRAGAEGFRAEVDAGQRAEMAEVVGV